MAIASPASFLGLPAELRNTIYALAFEGTTTGVDVPSKVSVDMTISTKSPTWAHGLTGILNANRQTRSEALGIFFATTTFVFTSGVTIVSWSMDLPPDLHKLSKRLCLQTGVYDAGDKPGEDILRQMHGAEVANIGDYLRRTCEGLDISKQVPSVRIWSYAQRKVVWPKEMAE